MVLLQFGIVVMTVKSAYLYKKCEAKEGRRSGAEGS
jgi:hypothetical protein